MDTLNINLSISEAEKIVYNAVVEGSFTGELLDSYRVATPNGQVLVKVFEKHYYRAGNRLTLTVIMDDTSKYTRVHLVGGGGGDGLFRFDWGASESFESVVINALSPYTV